MTLRARILLVLALAVSTVASIAVATATAKEDDTVTLTIGVMQDVDSPNVTVGYTVAAYELWNLQYATLTDKAAADFSIAPGLAESWEGSADGKTWTYTLRAGLAWSDGTAFTAADVAYTVNRARDEAWYNHTATVANLTAEAIDDRTVRIVSSVPDPKLPVMDVYIVPMHIYSTLDADALRKYEATDGVGTGPYTLSERKNGQFWRMTANPHYWRGELAVDEVVFRVFRNADAMVAALESGEIDAAHDVPSAAVERLGQTEGIVLVQGQQGGFEELALNGGMGGQGQEGGGANPALLDKQVRLAIAHAIDRQTILDRVYTGIGAVATTMSPSANPAWIPALTPEEDYAFDLAKANALLDEAGYKDTDGNGIREGKDGKDIVLRYALRTESPVSKPLYEFVSGWLTEIGIGTKVTAHDDGALGEVVGKGEYDLFAWGWTPFVDPDPMLSYFTCGQLSKDPEDPTNYYNDAAWCDPHYDELYKEQNVELDPVRRVEIVHEMLKLFHANASYLPLVYAPDLQAYRTDRFEGWVRQPAETGPVLFSNTSPTYWNLKVVGGGGGGGVSSGVVIVLAVLASAVVAVIAFATMRRRRSADERE